MCTIAYGKQSCGIMFLPIWPCAQNLNSAVNHDASWWLIQSYKLLKNTRIWTSVIKTIYKFEENFLFSVWVSPEIRRGGWAYFITATYHQRARGSHVIHMWSLCSAQNMHIYSVLHTWLYCDRETELETWQQRASSKTFMILLLCPQVCVRWNRRYLHLNVLLRHPISTSQVWRLWLRWSRWCMFFTPLIIKSKEWWLTHDVVLWIMSCSLPSPYFSIHIILAQVHLGFICLMNLIPELWRFFKNHI